MFMLRTSFLKEPDRPSWNFYVCYFNPLAFFSQITKREETEAFPFRMYSRVKGKTFACPLLLQDGFIITLGVRCQMVIHSIADENITNKLRNRRTKK